MAARKAPAPSASAELVPASRAIPTLRKHARGCTACPLYQNATQTVFGEGAAGARVMLVGEQPGDEEDRKGHPFVGPAGRLLREILSEAELPVEDLYLTNAVKHFKFEPRGKRRIHAKPTYGESMACRGWLDAEIEAVKPGAIVCLGATAAQSFMGRTFALTKVRGALHETRWSKHWLATWHPSALLRAPDHEARERMRAELIGDLRRAYEAAA